MGILACGQLDWVPFHTIGGLDAAIKYKAYEIWHVMNNYKPYTVHETEPATAVSRQLSGTTPDLDVLQQEGTPPQEFQRDESGVVVSQGLSSGWSYEKVARFKLIWWDKGSGSRDGVSIWRPIVHPRMCNVGWFGCSRVNHFSALFFFVSDSFLLYFFCVGLWW